MELRIRHRPLRIAALAFTACACVSCPPQGELGGGGVARIKVDKVKIDGSRDQRTYFSMRTTASQNGVGFVRPPYDLWGTFRVETTYGVEDPELFDATAGAAAVLELDARGPSPLEFYGIGGMVFTTPQRGINAYVQSHNGNHGAMFFPGAERIDVRIESNGTTLTFSAKAAGAVSYQQIDTLAIATPAAPMNAGMGFAFLTSSGELGYEFLRVPVNGDPPTPQGDQYDALQLYYEALFALQAAASEVNVASPYPLSAQEEIDSALSHLGESRDLIAGLDFGTGGAEGTDPVPAALKIVDKVVKTTQKLRAKTEQHTSNAARSITQTVAKKLYKPSLELTDLIITPQLRASLPSGDL